MKRSYHFYYFLIFVFALVIRGFYLFELQKESVFGIAMGDGLAYDEWGQKIAAGDWLGSGVFSQAPLYPYFLGILYKLFGHTLGIVLVIQTLLGAIACYLLAHAARLFFSNRAGVIAGLLLALYPTAVFYEGIIEKTSLVTFFLSATLLFLALSLKQKRTSWWFLCGVSLALLVLVRENTLVFFPVIVTFPFLTRLVSPTKAKLSKAVAFTVGFAFILIPVRARDHQFSGNLAPTSVQLGSNFYIGNSPASKGTYQPLLTGRGNAVYEWEDAVNLAEQDLGRKLTASEVSNFWLQQSFAYIKAQPFDWLKLLSKKGLLAWNHAELMDTYHQHVYGDISILLKILLSLFPFGILFPLGFAGLYLVWRRKDSSRAFVALFFAFTAAVMVFYVVSRYRYPLVLLLIPLASVSIVNTFDLFKTKQWAGISLLFLFVLIGTLLSHLPVVPRDYGRALGYYNLGLHFQKNGQPQKALSHYEDALRYSPTNIKLLNSVRKVATKSTNIAISEKHFLKALALKPLDPDIHTSYAKGLLQWGQPNEAAKHLHIALRSQPTHLDATILMAWLWEITNNFEKAEELLTAVLGQYPNNVRLHYSMGHLFEQQAKHDKAKQHYARAKQLDPTYPLPKNNPS